MSEKSEKTILPYADPYYLGSSDNSNSSLSSIIFNGSNYMNWSRSVRMALAAKNKLGFIDGRINKPSEDKTEELSKWTRNDNMIRCWLFASVSSEIAEELILCESAKQFWEELAERYGTTNAPQLYMIKRELNTLQQKDMSVGEYFGKFKRWWDEINNLEGFPECTCGGLKACSCQILKKIKEREDKSRVIDFLMGIDPEKYDVGNILSMDPLPNLNRAFHIVQQLEKQKEVSASIRSTGEASAFAATRKQNYPPQTYDDNYKQNHEVKGGQPRRESREEKNRKYFCDHCRMRGHTKEGCFKLIGYPDWFKKGKRVAGHAGNVLSGDGEAAGLETPFENPRIDEDRVVNNVLGQVLKALNIRQDGANSSTTMNFGNSAGPS